MRAARLLVGLLIAAWVSVDLVMLVIMRHPRLPRYHFPALPSLIVVALVFGQIGLLAILVGLGRRSSPWTWTGLFVGVVLEALFLGGTLHDNLEPGGVLASLLFLLFQAALVLAGLTLASWLGWAIQHRSQLVAGVGNAKPPFQFSLARLFGWTTGTAVCLGLAQLALAQTIDFSDTMNNLMEGTTLGLSNAMLALAAAGAVLGRSRAVARWTNLALAIPAAAWIETAGSPMPSSGDYLTLCALETVLFLASLMVVRLAGWRFERRCPRQQGSEARLV